jgi:hypothetical protein
VIALLILAAATSPSDAADAANLAFTQCLFATSRDASEARLSPGALEQKLANSCLSQQRDLERAYGGTRVHGLADAARRQVVDAYRKAVELEPELKQIGEMCRAHPEQCRD